MPQYNQTIKLTIEPKTNKHKCNVCTYLWVFGKKHTSLKVIVAFQEAHQESVVLSTVPLVSVSVRNDAACL